MKDLVKKDDILYVWELLVDAYESKAEWTKVLEISGRKVTITVEEERPRFTILREPNND